MPRHTDGKIVWTGTYSNQTTYPLDENGARYTIDRFGGEWVISFYPFATPDRGPRERVDWLPGKHSLTTAKAAVAAHHAKKKA